jgi:hypothetical protein
MPFELYGIQTQHLEFWVVSQFGARHLCRFTVQSNQGEAG